MERDAILALLLVAGCLWARPPRFRAVPSCPHCPWLRLSLAGSLFCASSLRGSETFRDCLISHIGRTLRLWGLWTISLLYCLFRMATLCCPVRPEHQIHCICICLWAWLRAISCVPCFSWFPFLEDFLTSGTIYLIYKISFSSCHTSSSSTFLRPP